MPRLSNSIFILVCILLQILSPSDWCCSVHRCGVTWGWNTGTAACCPCGCVSISMVLGAWSRTPLRITQTKQDSRLDDATLIIRWNKSRSFPFNSTIKLYSNVEQCSFCSIKLRSDGCPGVEFQQLKPRSRLWIWYSLSLLGILPRNLSWELQVTPVTGLNNSTLFFLFRENISHLRVRRCSMYICHVFL